MPAVYDLECYPNFFSGCFIDLDSDNTATFELSDRRDDKVAFRNYLSACQQYQVEQIGFNNVAYDYSLIHFFIEHYPNVDYAMLYAESQRLFQHQHFSNTVPAYKRFIPQIDLFLIHHFNNKNKMTGLKVIEINMRSPTVVDLPFPPGTILNDTEKNIVIRYNHHDVLKTKDFAGFSKPQIDFRRYLSRPDQLNRNVMNDNDGKIGKQYVTDALEKARPGSCFTRASGKREPVQTHRGSIALKDAVFPYIEFDQPEFRRIRDYFTSQVIHETKGVFTGLTCTINDFTFHFGVGGIHGSVRNTAVFSDDDSEIVDLDVTGYYPSIAIANRVYPAHLGELFCDVYTEVRTLRNSYKKKTPENEMLKLAGNQVYGESNNMYGPFYDPLYMLTITINGQLLLCLLSEKLMMIPGLKLIQINTDGVTVKCPRTHLEHMRKIMGWWQDFTKLELEEATYSRMFIRDVNSYLAEKSDGGVKRIGAYAYETALENPATRELPWHKDHSSLVVPKAAEAALLHGTDPYEFIINHADGYDFLIRAKVQRNVKLVLVDDNGNEKEIQRVSRYYVSKTGFKLFKYAPPKPGCKVGDYKRKSKLTDSEFYEVLASIPKGSWDERIHTKNKSKYQIVKTGFVVGHRVRECNDVADFNPADLDISYYVDEAHKLIRMLDPD